MLSRIATFVDAGYFFAASAQVVKGKQVPRRNLRITSPKELLKAICDVSIEISGSSDVLRTYWYDAMQSSRPSLEQTEIAMLAGVKLRLGTLNSAGEQKGVDSLIVTDIIELARNNAVADVILVSGDEDLRIAVQVAQTYGVRVHILAIGEHAKNVSQSLKMESDSFHCLDANWLIKHLDFTEPPTVASVVQSSVLIEKNTGITIEQAASEVSRELLKGQAAEVITGLNDNFKTSQSVPPEFDGKLIAKTAIALKRDLIGDEKRKARGVFVNTVKGLLA